MIKLIIINNHCFCRFNTYWSYFVLKCPIFGACWLNYCHLLFFYWFIYYCCAFLKANFNAFTFVFFDFFTFYGSFGRIFKFYGILNWSNTSMLLTLVSHFCSALVSALTVLPLPSHCTFYNGHDTHLHQFFKLCKGKIHHLPNIWLFNGFLLWKGMHLAILKLSNKKLEKLQSIIGHIFLFSHFVPRHQPQELKHFSTFFLL